MAWQSINSGMRTTPEFRNSLSDIISNNYDFWLGP